MISRNEATSRSVRESMGIVGDHPEGGIRFVLERTTANAPWVYEGSAYDREVEHRLRATVDAEGRVTVDEEGALPKDVVQRAKLLLRTSYKHAREVGGDQGEPFAPPRRVQRWRAS